MNNTMIILLGMVLLSATAQARERDRGRKHQSRNYILRRQEAGLVCGVPISRLMIGKREIDIYPNGMMFERDHLVGIKTR